mgnify:CR=1 FL=1|tara:strand:+ start:1108 stop:1482 length:375 start_codon:yes stop_codon:yes gene_type:complete
MADKEHTYGGQWNGQKKIKLKDLIKPGGMEVIPDEWSTKPKSTIKPDILLPVDKKIILKADDTDYERGLIVTWKKDGGYDVQYWFESPDNIVPAELKGDGKSKGKSIKKVYLGYHPELEDGKEY